MFAAHSAFVSFPDAYMLGLFRVPEQAIAERHPGLRVTTHLEPREDPRSYDDFGGVEIPIEPLPNPPTTTRETP